MPPRIKPQRPQPGPQTAFLSTPADIAVYGGSAGGGKTWAELYECLRHVNNPGFGAVIFRRESPQITNQGGLWDESLTLYPLAGGVPRVGELDWKFPSGAKVSFRHLQHEHDKQKWSGSQIPLIEFDELNHFTASQFWFMLSRNRSTCGVRPYIRASVNPGPGWVKELLAQWVDKTHPDPAASGELRWFVRVKGEVHWARDPASLVARFPAADGEHDLVPKSLTFIRASLFDNKILLAKDPGYLANLQALPEVERRQLLDGDWDVRRDGLVYPELAGTVCEPDEVPQDGERVGGIDWGWNDPFCALTAVIRDDVIWVFWERYVRFTTLPVHADALPHGGPTEIFWYSDPSRPENSAELNRGGHLVRPCVHRGAAPILDGIDRVTERIRTGRLRVSRACQNLLREASLYHFDPVTGKPVDQDNHSMDALRYLVVGRDRGRAVKARRAEGPRRAQTDALRAEAEAEKAKAKTSDKDHPRWWGSD